MFFTLSELELCTPESPKLFLICLYDNQPMVRKVMHLVKISVFEVWPHLHIVMCKCVGLTVYGGQNISRIDDWIDKNLSFSLYWSTTSSSLSNNNVLDGVKSREKNFRIKNIFLGRGFNDFFYFTHFYVVSIHIVVFAT